MTINQPYSTSEEIIDLSNPDLYNHVYIPLLHDKKRYNILYGGRDSGKSDCISQLSIIHSMDDDFFRLILLRKYYASIKQSQFQTIIDWIRIWELSDLFHITTNPLLIVCRKNNNQILARGLDQPDNTKSIKDPTAIWYEEADQISEDAMTESSLSLRSSSPNVILKEWISYNPRKEHIHINKNFFPEKHTYEKADGKFHWVKSTNPNATILHTTYKDNRFCTKDRIDRLESLKYQDENYYKVNTLGLWGGALKGLIYPDWTPVDEFPEGGDVVFGLDWGFNHPCALIMESYVGDMKLYLKELLYINNHTHQQLARLMVADYKELIGQKPIYVDSAAPELIKELKGSGFNAIPTVKGPDSVYKGILLVKQFKLFITKDSPNLMKECQSYIWKGDRDGNLLDEPVKVDDHACDAVRYPVQSYGQKYWMPTPQQSGVSIHKRDKQRKEFLAGF